MVGGRVSTYEWGVGGAYTDIQFITTYLFSYESKILRSTYSLLLNKQKQKQKNKEESSREFPKDLIPPSTGKQE